MDRTTVVTRKVCLFKVAAISITTGVHVHQMLHARSPAPERASRTPGRTSSGPWTGRVTSKCTPVAPCQQSSFGLACGAAPMLY